MTDWITNALGESALRDAQAVIGKSALAEALVADKPHLSRGFSFVAEGVELSAFALLDDVDKRPQLRAAAEVAFEHLRTLPRNGLYSPHSTLLRAACYGILADRTSDVFRTLRNVDFSLPDLAGNTWVERVRISVLNVWYRLIRKKGWEDLDAVTAGVVHLRAAQKDYEDEFLRSRPDEARLYAWELVASYHLAKAAEILATYSAQGVVGGGFDVREQLQSQFDRSIVACQRAELIDLFSLVRLLASTADRMVSNSI